MARSLEKYNEKRDFAQTPEPSGGTAAIASANRFVVQEHHARRLHWDFRLERDGVLVSWAVPKGIPADPSVNHLAVPTEDHPLSYIDFAGEIPKGNYGAGKVTIWDEGVYECHKWEPREVMVTLHGRRVEGRYVLFRTGEDRWMIHRMDPPQDPTREGMPGGIMPMLAITGTLPADDAAHAYEVKWDGVRALLSVEGGRISIVGRKGNDITPRYPELGPLGRAVGSREVILDGEVVALDDSGRPSFQRLQARMHVESESVIRRRMSEIPAAYMIFDLLWLDGHSLMDRPYTERRARLDELALAGPSWQTPGFHVGDGAALLDVSAAQGLEGIVAKRADSIYEPGRRSRAWIKIKNVCRQEFVVGGWVPGEGGRSGRIGALVVGYHDEGDKLRYAGRVGTGFTEKELNRLFGLLEPLRRDTSPFDPPPPPAVRRLVQFVEPRLVAEVAFREWTREGTLRQPSYQGVRDDKDPRGVVREQQPGG
jgi:bifunctional non-homologous end joining protein LigD